MPARLPHEKIGARPAFHYRLPHAYVGDETWSLLADWNDWVAVETLAIDRDRLDALGYAYRRFEGKPAAWADVVAAAGRALGISRLLMSARP